MIKQLLVLVLGALHTMAVNRPPSMTVHPADKNIFFKEGESVIINCIADGTPRPIYKWTVNGKEFNPSGHDSAVVQLPNQGTIVFNKPEDKHEGIYQCFADNGYGVAVSIQVNLREAKLNTFPYQQRQIYDGVAGNHLKLPCTPPLSVPSADVYWVIKETGGQWQAINFDNRISMDLDGNLRFTNVKKSDEKGGRAYCCMAINYKVRENSIGPEYEIQVSGTTEQKRPASELWTSPSNQAFLKNGTLKLKCIFAGNPTPKVYWEKIDGSLPDRTSFKSFGQELHITDLKLSDAGQYECMGLNTQSQARATKSFIVEIQSAPEWEERPENQEKSTNERAVFICKATGNPVPEYDWFINGVPIEDKADRQGVRDPRIYNNPRFFKTGKYNRTLANLTLEDHMNIQCNASNIHGYVFADVYINVMEEAPTIITPPPPEVKVAEGRSVVITCVVTGKPDPIVTWYRDTNLITGGRFKIQPNGNLYIENVVMADAGDYRCQASNKFAKDVTSSTCKMQIRRKTRIEQFPLDLEVVAGNDAKFTCSGSTDFDEAGQMQIYWKKDDKFISTSENRMMANTQDNSLTISGSVVRDSGVYACVITNGLDEDVAYAFLTVKDRPNPPSSLSLERCRPRQADLKWVKGIENNAPVIHFMIQYSTTFNQDQWVTAKRIEPTQNTASIELQPWANYTFRVIATNKIGTSLPSVHTAKVCTTNAAYPNRNPQNLRSIGDKIGVLKIEWIPMTQMEHNGPKFKYRVTIKQRGSAGSSTTYNIDQWQNNSLEHPSSLPYQPFTVKIRAQNSIGDSLQDDNTKTLYSYEDVPNAVVTNVQVTEIGSDSATLSWSWEKEWMEEYGQINDIRGEFRGFKVQYWRQGEKLSTFREVEVIYTEILPKNLATSNQQMTAEYILKDLPAYTIIEIQICLINNYYVGRPSDALAFTTFEGVPGPVQYFATQIRSSNSFSLVWEKIPLEDRNGVLLGYDITYQLVNGLKLDAVHDRNEQITDNDVTSAVLSGLLPNMKYRIHIYGRTKYGRGEGSFIEATTTKESEFGAPQFDIKDIKESSINVTWSAGAHYGMHVVHYVEYRLEGASDWQQSADEVLKLYKVITNLERGTYYEVRVVAFDGQYRAFTEIKVVATVGFAAAKSLAANYGWFIAMLVSGILLIAISVFIYWIHKSRKTVEEKPRPPKRYGKRDRDGIEDEDLYHDRDGRRDSYDDYHDDDRGGPSDKRYDDYDRYDEKEKRRFLDDDDEKRDRYDDEKRGRYDDDRYERDSYHDDDRDSYRDDRHRDTYRDEYDRDRDDYDRDEYDDRYDQEYDRRDRYDDDDDYDRGYARNGKDRHDDDHDDGSPPTYREAAAQSKPPIPRKRKDKTYDEYKQEPSKFDENGAPIEQPPPTQNTSV